MSKPPLTKPRHRSLCDGYDDCSRPISPLNTPLDPSCLGFGYVVVICWRPEELSGPGRWFDPPGSQEAAEVLYRSGYAIL